MQEEITYGSTFTGIGGFDLGFDQAGMRCLWQVEKDDDCNRVLRRQWPAGHRGRLVEEVHPDRYARPDVLCGGFPCQDLSVAGRRKGLAGERSGLFWEFHRIADIFKPSIFVLENVPGLFTSNEGRDFLALLGGMEDLGYCLAWTVLDSQYFGVAQRRERVFIVGSLGDGRCAEILFEPESVRWDPPPSREAGQGSADRLTRGAGVRGDIGKALRSSDGGIDREDGHTLIPLASPLTGRSGRSEDRGDGLDNIIAARMTAFGEYVDDGTASTLKERDYKDATDLIATVADPICANEQRTYTHEGKNNFRTRNLVAFTCKDNGQDAGEQSPTLRAMTHDKSNANGGGQVAVAFDTTQITHPENRSNPKPGGPCHRGGHAPAVARIGSSVRRLTPRECERLQGFPDDWTRWDDQGREISDSARYRMLGNAVTTTVAKWIGMRIVKFF